MIRRCAAVLLAVAVTGSACTPATDAVVIHASDYDQSCTTAADCAGVTDGNVCIDEVCDFNTSVNVHDRDRFVADRAQAKPFCDGEARLVCAACHPTPAQFSCDGGTCHLLQGACAGN